MDDAFNNRIEVEETDLADDKMSYYSSQEMGKAGERDAMGSLCLSHWLKRKHSLVTGAI